MLDRSVVRSQFPPLEHPAGFLDHPSGTLIARQCLDPINRYLIEGNAFEFSCLSAALRLLLIMIGFRWQAGFRMRWDC
jgi:hypothetical protein